MILKSKMNAKNEITAIGALACFIIKIQFWYHQLEIRRSKKNFQENTKGTNGV